MASTMASTENTASMVVTESTMASMEDTAKGITASQMTEKQARRERLESKLRKSKTLLPDELS